MVWKEDRSVMPDVAARPSDEEWKVSVGLGSIECTVCLRDGSFTDIVWMQ